MKITIPTAPNPNFNHHQQRPPENVFLIPEGDYRATLKQVKPHNGKIRLVFTVIVPGCPSPYLAGKNYLDDLSSVSALRNDLFSWRGHDLTPEEYRAQSFDTNALLGKPADIRIGHIDNAGHENPFVYIKSIHPPGTLAIIDATHGLDQFNTESHGPL